METRFTARGLEITDEIRETAQRKLAPLERLEPRTTRIDLELISEHHPKVDGTIRIEAALHVPRKTFRATADAPTPVAAIDAVKEKLERQLRDHHGKKRVSQKGRGLESAPAVPGGGAEDTA